MTALDLQMYLWPNLDAHVTIVLGHFAELCKWNRTQLLHDNISWLTLLPATPCRIFPLNLIRTCFVRPPAKPANLIMDKSGHSRRPQITAGHGPLSISLLTPGFTPIKPPGFGHLILVCNSPAQVTVVGASTNPMQTGTKLCHFDALLVNRFCAFLQFSYFKKLPASGMVRILTRHSPAITALPKPTCSLPMAGCFLHIVTQNQAPPGTRQ